MSAILVLIALMSVATLASRRGYAAFIAHIVTTPILLGFGLLMGSRGLAFITASTADALDPALRVGVAWLALLVGLRGARPKRLVEGGADTAFLIVAMVITWSVLSGVAFAGGKVLGFFGLAMETANETHALLGAALLVGGALAPTGYAFAVEAIGDVLPGPGGRRFLFLTRHDDIAGTLGLCAALWLWPLDPNQAPIYLDPGASVGATLGIGATLALAQVLAAGGKATSSHGAITIAIVGLVVFAAGLAQSTHLPEAAIAFFFGGFLALVGRGKSLLADYHLARTERPVRLVVLVLVGTYVGFAPAAIVIGVLLALARALVKLGLRWALNKQCRDTLPVGAVLGSSGLAIPYALSFALTRPGPLVESQVLTAVAVAVAVTDLMTLLAWRKPAFIDAEPAATDDAARAVRRGAR